MKKIILWAFLCLCLANCIKDPAGNKKQVRDLPVIIEEFQYQLAKDVKEDNIQGSLSAAVLIGDQIIWSKAFGNLDLAHQIPADTSSIYRTGSISKSFTTFLMMQLMEEGIIKLDEPIEKYLPEIKGLKGYTDSTKITFQEIASHTSGLQREPELEDASKGPIEEWEDKVLASISHTSFQSKPGEKYSYSNMGFGILGLALSRAAGQPFIEMIEDKIFKPLQMNNSFFVIPAEKKVNLAQGMEGGPFGKIDTDTPAKEHEGRGYKVPNGAIYSTPRDLAKFMKSNLGYSGLLGDSSLNLLHNPGIIEEEDWWQSYGLGFTLIRDSSLFTIGHGGSVSGYTASIKFDKACNCGVAIMRNYNWGMTNLDLRAIALIRELKKRR